MEETPRPAREGPRSKKRRQTRNRLLEEGLALMAQRGIHACKVEEITRAAGVGKGTFFTHFKSKEEFVAVLVDQVLNDLVRRVRPLGLSPTDAESLLAGVGTVHLRYFQLRPQAAALLNQAVGLVERGEAGRAIKERLAQHLDAVAQMLTPACQPLGWPPEHARELALMVLANAVGFFYLGAPLGLGGDTPMSLLDRLGRVLARGLARKDQPPQ